MEIRGESNLYRIKASSKLRRQTSIVLQQFFWVAKVMVDSGETMYFRRSFGHNDASNTADWLDILVFSISDNPDRSPASMHYYPMYDLETLHSPIELFETKITEEDKLDIAAFKIGGWDGYCARRLGSV